MIDLAKYVNHAHTSGQLLETDIVAKTLGACSLIKVRTRLDEWTEAPDLDSDGSLGCLVLLRHLLPHLAKTRESLFISRVKRRSIDNFVAKHQ